ncbi:hypothetical protein [Polaromonas sp. YR568]|uniref:hypothetical protein n=1 Tax=Polaromonas sp. YR568 TaxID=1855301 RepID=UPI00398BDF72
MKLRNTQASRTVRAAAQVCMTVVLAGCATAPPAPAPSNDQAGPPNCQTAESTLSVPPGHRLEKFVLHYEERRLSTRGFEGPIKRFDIDVSLLVPRDDCLQLDANGWLSVVPGQCSRAPTKTPCEEKP